MMELPNRGHRVVLGALMLLAVSAAACAADAPTQSSSPRSSSPAPSPPQSVTESPDRGDGDQEPPIPEILRFTAPGLGGGTIDGESFAGSNVALWFWAPW